MATIEWLRDLHKDLWPERRPRIELDAKRTLTQQEWAQVVLAIEEHRLIVEMFSSSMFGGYGVHLYIHPTYPGLPPEGVLTLVEDHLPLPTCYDHILGTAQTIPKRHPGCGRDDAWEVFTKFAHRDKNVAWLKQYGLRSNQSRSYYDY